MTACMHVSVERDVRRATDTAGGDGRRSEMVSVVDREPLPSIDSIRGLKPLKPVHRQRAMRHRLLNKSFQPSHGPIQHGSKTPPHDGDRTPASAILSIRRNRDTIVCAIRRQELRTAASPG